MITREMAIELGSQWGQATLYHRTERNRDGTAVRIRVNGKCQTWKRDSARFRLPCKYGFKGYGVDVTPSNASEWLLADPTGKGWESYHATIAEGLARQSAARALGFNPCHMPTDILTDVLKEAGVIPM